jgi:hypothetical protein
MDAVSARELITVIAQSLHVIAAEHNGEFRFPVERLKLRNNAAAAWLRSIAADVSDHPASLFADLAASLAPYVSPDDVGLPKREFLALVADRIKDDLTLV